MKLTNLETEPDYYQDTIDLIETSFGYKKGHSFKVDFFPLMAKRNNSHNYVLIENNQVIAHTGVLEKTIALKNNFKIAFIGGVAVREDHRRQGLAQRLLDHVLKAHSTNALFFLWSDKKDFYRKFDFFPCVELYSCPQTNGESSFQRLTPTEEEWNQISALYKNSREVRVQRAAQDWSEIKEISSADIYAKKVNGKIKNYFFINKGMDLQGIIHEYGSLEDQAEIMTHGSLWASRPGDHATPLFGALARLGNTKVLRDFVFEYTKGAFDVIEIDDKVRFTFSGESFALSKDEFLQGIFGPGRLEELADAPKLFISGMDSI